MVSRSGKIAKTFVKLIREDRIILKATPIFIDLTELLRDKKS
jgi:hypothetical protein